MNPSLVIEPVRTPGDLAAVVELCDGFLEWCRGHYGDAIVDTYYGPEKWAAIIASLPEVHAPPDGEMLIARLDGRPVGCAMLHKLEAGICEMKRLYVSAAAQGHGLGRKLCERLLAIAVERGYAIMRLDTGITQDVAKRLYVSLGFRFREPYYDVPADLRPHLVFMEADLRPK